MRGAGSDFVLLDGRAALPADIGPLPAKLADLPRLNHAGRVQVLRAIEVG